jgi:predicted MFS family arabinose efflux permease
MSTTATKSISPASGNYRWYLVGMLWTVGFFNYADRQAIFTVFPLLQSRLHLSLVQLGLVGSAFAWVYGLAAPFSGFLVDRIRRKTAILG